MWRLACFFIVCSFFFVSLCRGDMRFLRSNEKKKNRWKQRTTYTDTKPYRYIQFHCRSTPRNCSIFFEHFNIRFENFCVSCVGELQAYTERFYFTLSATYKVRSIPLAAASYTTHDVIAQSTMLTKYNQIQIFSKFTIQFSITLVDFHMNTFDDRKKAMRQKKHQQNHQNNQHTKKKMKKCLFVSLLWLNFHCKKRRKKHVNQTQWFKSNKTLSLAQLIKTIWALFTDNIRAYQLVRFEFRVIALVIVLMANGHTLSVKTITKIAKIEHLSETFVSLRLHAMQLTSIKKHHKIQIDTRTHTHTRKLLPQCIFCCAAHLIWVNSSLDRPMHVFGSIFYRIDPSPDVTITCSLSIRL